MTISSVNLFADEMFVIERAWIYGDECARMRVHVETGVPSWWMPKHARRKRIATWSALRATGLRITKDSADDVLALLKDAPLRGVR